VRPSQPASRSFSELGVRPLPRPTAVKSFARVKEAIENQIDRYGERVDQLEAAVFPVGLEVAPACSGTSPVIRADLASAVLAPPHRRVAA
jgi:hypothetical protein